jgi:hypothetical protein
MALSESKIQIVRMKAREAGDYLIKNMEDINDLPALNPYSFIWDMLNRELGRNYKECEDNDVPQMIEIIEEYKNNPI